MMNSFFRQLKMTLNTLAPTEFRTALATYVLSIANRFAKCRKAKKEEWIRGELAHNRLVSAIKRRMVYEKMPEIRSFFLRLLAITPFFGSFDYFGIKASDDCLLSVLEQELTQEEESSAILLLFFTVNARQGDDVVTANRVVRINVRRLSQHLNKMRLLSESDLRRVLYFLWTYIRFASAPLTMDPLLDHPQAMPFLFDSLRSTRIMLPLLGAWGTPSTSECNLNPYARLLCAIFKTMTATSRQTLIRDHFVQVQEAILLMSHSHDCLWCFSDFAVHEEFADIIIRMPTVMGNMATKLREAGNDTCNTSYVVTALMHGLRNNDRGMTELLGYGLLAVVRGFAHLRYFDNAQVLASFRSVLIAHPEWKRQFKMYTQGGDANSRVWQMGQAIVDRVHTPGTYVMEDYVNDI